MADELSYAEVRRLFRANLIEPSSCMDEEFWPRELPFPDQPTRYLRTTDPDTRYLYVYEYPEYVLRNLWDLLVLAKYKYKVKAALRAAVHERKSLKGIAATIIQVLPRDFRAAMRELEREASGQQGNAENEKKRLADAPPPEQRPQKQTVLDKSDGEQGSQDGAKESEEPVSTNAVIRTKMLEDIPEPLRETLSTLRTMSRGPPTPVELRASIPLNDEQSVAELYQLNTEASERFQASIFEEQDPVITYDAVTNIFKHWQYKCLLIKGSKQYQKLMTETGFLLHEGWEKVLERGLIAATERNEQLRREFFAKKRAEKAAKEEAEKAAKEEAEKAVETGQGPGAEGEVKQEKEEENAEAVKTSANGQ